MRFQSIDKYDEMEISDDNDLESSIFGELFLEWKIDMNDMLFCFTEYNSEEDRDEAEEIYYELETCSNFVREINDQVILYSLDERYFALLDIGYTNGIIIKRKDKVFFENYIL